MDVKIAFLNGELEEDIYMEQPESFVVPGHEVIICLYVDDMLIESKSMTDINATKRMLVSKFNMKDLGVADLILGIRIHKTPQGLGLSQSHYIEKVLDMFKYLDFKIAKAPIDVSYALQKNEAESDS
ncbi:uncharacterized mitochondrial protein AtMg00810-like [Nicotiana sylvestris]|uniref:uncharacterized mitochondrial protein AtMg00810-like n=1 Tax=Nicotiana sylvestris TaxID=4096 RepID=UPI00388CA372